jgi:hypothetical protein
VIVLNEKDRLKLETASRIIAQQEIRFLIGKENTDRNIQEACGRALRVASELVEMTYDLYGEEEESEDDDTDEDPEGHF